MSARNRFRDGAEILPTYEWQTGYEEEDPEEKSISIQRTALTTGVDFVRQQGAPAPTIRKLKGWILHNEQRAKMEAYYNACAGIGTAPRTVFWRDIDGVEYEVMITSFEPQKVIGKNKDGEPWAEKFSLTMEVV